MMAYPGVATCRWCGVSFPRFSSNEIHCKPCRDRFAQLYRAIPRVGFR